MYEVEGVKSTLPPTLVLARPKELFYQVWPVCCVSVCMHMCMHIHRGVIIKLHNASLVRILCLLWDFFKTNWAEIVVVAVVNE